MNGSEYENYGNQYQTFQKIIAVYDTEPDNFPRYMRFTNEIKFFNAFKAIPLIC